MNTIQPFGLEDFFDQYEHDSSERINLASSDALPWSRQELSDRASALDFSIAVEDFAYPDIKALRSVLSGSLGLPDDRRILPTGGAAEAIALVMHELAARKASQCRVALPAPSYGAFAGLAGLLGLTAVHYDYARSRRWTAEPSEIIDLAGKCDALIVLNPHNPTGQEIDTNVLEEAAQVLEERGGTLIIDEVFRDPDKPNRANFLELGSQVIVIGSLSKMYGLPGLRLGWVMAEPSRLKTLRTVQQYLTLAPPSATLALAQPILANLASFSRGALVRGNRKTIIDWAAAHSDRISISSPTGGTTVVLEVRTDRDEETLFQQFLNQGVLLVPGRRFETNEDGSWFRLGYGTEASRLKQGLDRIDAALQD